MLVVRQGTVVMQAAPANFTLAGPSPNAYYVLRDHVALFGNEITNPTVGRDTAGAPDVQFAFKYQGGPAIRHLTASVAHRGELLSTGTRPLRQHFAVALDDRLITVPQIDYTQYPDGISGNQGADLMSGFTRSAAQGLVTFPG